MKVVKKSITLNHVGWKITGTAIIKLINSIWGYCEGKKEFIVMDSVILRQDAFPTRKEIAKCINAGKFRYKSIESADVRLWQVFDRDQCIIIDDFEFSSKEILMNVKRGI